MAADEALPTASGRNQASAVTTTPDRGTRRPNNKNKESNTDVETEHVQPGPANRNTKQSGQPRAHAHARSPSLSLHHVGLGLGTPAPSPTPLLRQLSSHFSSPTNPADDELSDGDDQDPGPDGSPYSGFGFGLGLGLGRGLGSGPGPGSGVGREEAQRTGKGEVELELEREVDDLTQDRRDVLVERLADLIRRLQRVPAAAVLDELHGKVDEMEGALSFRDGSIERLPQRGTATGISTISDGVPSPAPLLGTKTSPEKVDIPETTAVATSAANNLTTQVVESAEALNARLAAALASLRARKEESDHIHALLVERAEAAASRILELEQEIADLYDELNTNDSDLRHLRLELRAVETLCNSSAQSGARADPELVRSIENWKADWARLRERLSADKKRRRGLRHGFALGEGEGMGESTILTASFASVSAVGGVNPGV